MGFAMVFAIFTLNGTSAELDLVAHDKAAAKAHCRDLRAMGFELAEMKIVECDDEGQAYHIAEIAGEGISLTRAIKESKQCQR